MSALKIVRLIIAALFVLLILYYIDFKEVINQFSNLDPLFGSLFLLISWPLIWVSCEKWKLFIPKSHVMPSTQKLMKYYTVSYFANLFSPSTLGGDVARSYKLGRQIENQVDAFIATFLERLTGLLAMVILCSVALFFRYSLLSEFKIPVFISTILVILLSVLFLSESGSRLLTSIVNSCKNTFFGNTKIVSMILKIVSSHSLLDKGRKVVWKALFWSVLFHSLTVVNTYFAAMSLSIDSVSFLELFVVVPLVLLVSMVPITPGGIGIQEGAFVFLLGRIGLPPVEALSIAILLRTKTLLLAVLGGVFFFREER